MKVLREHFDDSVDNATHAIITEFKWINLPEKDQLTNLMVEINNALSAIMIEWLSGD